jgi:8-oxo-dGTP diphosphatase
LIIASSAQIIRNKTILLIKRSDYTPHFPGHWTCPGGRAEPGETPEENVIREVREEVGLAFTPVEILARGVYQDRDLYRFLGPWSGEVGLQEAEAEDWGWFSYDAALALPLAFDYRQVIELLGQRKLL